MRGGNPAPGRPPVGCPGVVPGIASSMREITILRIVQRPIVWKLETITGIVPHFGTIWKTDTEKLPGIVRQL